VKTPCSVGEIELFGKYGRIPVETKLNAWVDERSSVIREQSTPLATDWGGSVPSYLSIPFEGLSLAVGHLTWSE